MANVKEQLVVIVLDLLKAKLDVLIRAALDARDAATNEESKPENEYDTRGIEASYLAGAQAKRANELQEEILIIGKVDIHKKTKKVEIGSLVTVLVEGDDEKVFFVLPAAAGEKLMIKNKEYLVVTPASPVGSRLMGAAIGDEFDLNVGNKNYIYEITEID